MKKIEKLQNTQKIYITLSIIGVTFLVWFITRYYYDIVPEFIDYPKTSNSNASLQSIEVDGKTYQYARLNDKQPTLGELLDASNLINADTSNQTAVQSNEQVASGEARNEISLDSVSRIEPIKLLLKYVDHLENASVIINYVYSDHTSTVFNNRLNEEVQEDSSGGIQLINSNGKLFTVADDGVTAQPSIQNITVLRNVLNQALKNPSNVEFKAVDAGGGYISYQVTFDQISDFVKIYDNLQDEDKSMVAQSIADELTNENGEYKEAKVCFEFIAGNDWSLNVYNTVVLDGTYVLNWYFQGFYETFDWRLQKTLYSERATSNDIINTVNSDIESVRELMEAYSKVKIDYDTGEITLQSEEG